MLVLGGPGKMRLPRTCCDIAATMFVSPKKDLRWRESLTKAHNDGAVGILPAR